MRAFDMSRHERIIGTDGRISGNWIVLGGAKPGAVIWIKPHDVTIYDESRQFGAVLGRDDLQASATDGVVDLGIVRDRVKHDVNEVRSLMLVTLTAVARAFAEGVGSVVEIEPVEEPADAPRSDS